MKKEWSTVKTVGHFTNMMSSATEEAETVEVKEKAIRDFDEEPYGNDNLMVRASKRRAYFTSVSEF